MESYWSTTCTPATFEPLDSDMSVDVTIIGGGMVGITTAALLKEHGLTVAVVEARRVGQGVSGKATAKVTTQHGIKYRTIAEKFGEEGARAYAHAQGAGVDLICDLARAHGIDCDLEEKAAFVYATEGEHGNKIKAEVELARKIGLPASLSQDTGLPFDVHQAMRWDRQYQFHPVKFIAGLAARIADERCRIFEQTRAHNWSPTSVTTKNGTITSKHVVMATNLPLGQVGLYYAMNYPKAEPVIVAPIENPPPHYYLHAGSPGRSLRTHTSGGRTFAIAVGEHFHPGHPETIKNSFDELSHWLEQHFDVGDAEHQWVNEDYSPMDGMPFVGWSSAIGNGYLVATGFDAWGFSNGGAAAIMLRDLIAEQENPWFDFFSATRIKPLAGGKKFVHENMHVARHIVNDYTSSKPQSYEEVGSGEAAILSIDGDDVAAFRDDDGSLHAVSAACPHMGCLVGWNPTDRTWDCPCHGSRFGFRGEVLHGPAVENLAEKVR